MMAPIIAGIMLFVNTVILILNCIFEKQNTSTQARAEMLNIKLKELVVKVKIVICGCII